MERAQKKYILKDLTKKIVLLVGPRQSGKSWLAKNILDDYQHGLYLNYDNIQDRNIMEEQSWDHNIDLLVLDELHKMPVWKNYLKGIFDTKKPNMHLLVTGSSRLDVYDRIGDSLAGRYFRHRLLPFSMAELKQIGVSKNMNHLLEHGGFPEPFLEDELLIVKKWRQQYINSLLSTDIFTIDNVNNMNALRLLFELLRTKVGSPISYQSLANELEISPTTVKIYIQILEALYVIFKITPFSKNIARSLLKEPKIYFFDPGLIENNDGAKLENLVACSLLKHTYGKEDYPAEPTTLHYMRTKEGKEVDFVLVNNNQVEQIIEVKNSNQALSPTLKYFYNKYGYPATQIVKNLRNSHREQGISIVNAEEFLSNLFL